MFKAKALAIAGLLSALTVACSSTGQVGSPGLPASVSGIAVASPGIIAQTSMTESVERQSLDQQTVRPAESTLFTDTFESDAVGSAAKGWSPQSGSWKVCQPPRMTHEYCDEGANVGLSTAGNTSWTNYEADASLFHSTDSGSIALLGRVRDASNYYEFSIHSDGRNGQDWYFGTSRGGTLTKLGNGPLNVAIGQTAQIRLVFAGSSITAYSGQTKLASFSDGTYTSGGIGLRVSASTTSGFDNVVVTSSTSSTPTPSPSDAPTTPPSSPMADTFGGCQLFPTNDYVNLDVFKVPADATSDAQIASAASTGVTTPQGPFESNVMNSIPYNAPLAAIHGNPHPFADSPWPIGNSTTLPYRNGMLPHQPNEDATDEYVQQAGGGKPCMLRVAGYMFPAGSPSGTSWNAYGGGTFDLSKPEGQYGLVGGGTGMSTSGIPGRAFDPRPDEFIKGIIPHAVDIELPVKADCKPSVGNQYPSLQGGQGTIAKFPCLVGGAKLRLKSSFSDSGYSGDALTMIYQLKHYGGLVIDNGCCFGIYFMEKQNGTGGVKADARDTNMGAIGGLFSHLDIHNFEVVKMGPLDGSSFTYPGLDTSTGKTQGY